MADITSLKQEYSELMQKAKNIQEQIKSFNKQNPKVVIKSLSHNDFQHSLDVLGNTVLGHIYDYGTRYPWSTVSTFTNSYENNISNYARIKEFFNIANLASGGVRSWSAYIRYDDIRNILKNQNNLDVIGQAAYQRSWQDGYWYAQVYEYPSYRPFINYKD